MLTVYPPCLISSLNRFRGKKAVWERKEEAGWRCQTAIICARKGHIDEKGRMSCPGPPTIGTGLLKGVWEEKKEVKWYPEGKECLSRRSQRRLY